MRFVDLKISKEIISNPSKDKEDKIRQTQTQQYLTIPNNLWYVRRVCNNMCLKHLETERTTAHQSTLGSGFHGHSLGHPLNRIFVSLHFPRGMQSIQPSPIPVELVNADHTWWSCCIIHCSWPLPFGQVMWGWQTCFTVELVLAVWVRLQVPRDMFFAYAFFLFKSHISSTLSTFTLEMAKHHNIPQYCSIVFAPLYIRPLATVSQRHEAIIDLPVPRHTCTHPQKHSHTKQTKRQTNKANTNARTGERITVLAFYILSGCEHASPRVQILDILNLVVVEI